MHYVVSDIHGCYKEYKELLKKIAFSDSDTLYVLGDVIDRGDGGFEVLRDMMQYANIVPMIAAACLVEDLLRCALKREKSFMFK